MSLRPQVPDLRFTIRYAADEIAHLADPATFCRKLGSLACVTVARFKSSNEQWHRCMTLQIVDLALELCVALGSCSSETALSAQH
jgi:hypothetical protein